MTPEKQQALQAHIQVIAKILYEDTLPERLTNLAGIEEAVNSSINRRFSELSPITRSET